MEAKTKRSNGSTSRDGSSTAADSFDRINARAYGSWQAAHAYGNASGWLDPGEQKLLEYPGPDFAAFPALDIGFGGGRTVPIMRGLFPIYLGIDYTPSLVRVARKRFPDADLRIMDARELDFPDNYFGVAAFSFNGIDSVDLTGRTIILREVYRVLRPGGYFLFSSLNRGSLNDDGPLPLPALPPLRRPRALASWVFALPFSLRNLARLNPMVRITNDRATRPIPAHACGIIAIYTSLAAQIAELTQAGFEVDAVFDNVTGRVRNKDEAATDAGHLHYAARKPAL